MCFIASGAKDPTEVVFEVLEANLKPIADKVRDAESAGIELRPKTKVKTKQKNLFPTCMFLLKKGSQSNLIPPLFSL